MNRIIDTTIFLSISDQALYPVIKNIKEKYPQVDD